MSSAPQLGDARWKIARAFPRFHLNVKVTITMTQTAGTTTAVGRTLDVGLGGMAVEMDPPLLARERGTVEFILPMVEQPLKLLVKVMHVEGLRHGLQFLTITPEQRELIRRACERLPRT